MTDPQTPFGPEVVAQIMAHMNDDHTEDNLLIVRTLGGYPAAERAWMSGLDADGIEFAVTVDGREVRVRLSWSRRLTERAQVRQEVVAMHERALARSAAPGPATSS